VVSVAEIAELVVALMPSCWRSSLDEVNVVRNTAVQTLVVRPAHARLEMMLIARVVAEGLAAQLAPLAVSWVWLARVVGAHSATVAAPAYALVAMGGGSMERLLTIDAIEVFAEESAWLTDTVKVLTGVENADIMLRVLTLVVWSI